MAPACGKEMAYDKPCALLSNTVIGYPIWDAVI